MLSRHEKISRARIALERGGRISTSLLKPQIADSWQRCIEAGLDPRGRVPAQTLTAPELNEKHAQARELRRFALAEMQALYHQISGSNFMIALGDPDGVVLDTISDAAFQSSEPGKGIMPGSLWGEAEHGTNALGTCAVTRLPTMIHGLEHFFHGHSDVSCIAAPIFHSTGQLAGVLDASSDCQARQHHTMALMRMAATHIENNLFQTQQADNFVFMFHPREEFMNSVSGGLLAFDSTGRLAAANQRGREMLVGLGVKPGVHFEAIFDAPFEQRLDQFHKAPHLWTHDRLGSRYAMRWLNSYRREIPRQVSKHTRPIDKTCTAESRISFIAADVQVARQLQNAEKGARLKVPILVLGETGTGKEVMARYIHQVSGRKGEFVAVNCGAIPKDLFEAELFGYAPGAFTNARKEGSKGLIRAADGGTLFLDEMGDLPHASQVALLRFLDSYEVRRVGDSKTDRVDVQIVAATNIDLAEAIAAKKFRSDLYYRLNVVEIELPPLRERMDFAQLARHLLKGLSAGLAITDQAVEVLSKQHWPGNLRELRSTLTRLALNASAQIIDVELLKDFLPLDMCATSLRPDASLRDKMQQTIETALRTHNGNVSRVAKMLNVSRTTVYKYTRRG